MSYLYFNGLTAIARAAAKDQLRRRRSFFQGAFDMRLLSLYRTIIRKGATLVACWLIYSGIGNRI
jgi:hypothetical protein